MNVKTVISSVAKIVLPFVLGGAILWWMYRGEDFSVISHVLTEEMNWTWMLLSFPFGILAQLFRAWRWKQTLEPIISGSEECGVRSENSSATDSSLHSNLTPHSTLHTPQKNTASCQSPASRPVSQILSQFNWLQL